MTRYALRVDQNQDQIISVLEAAGATVEVIGLPVDLLVGTVNSKGEKVFAFFEVKDGPKKKMTAKQLAFFDKYPGWPVCLVDSPETALRLLRVVQA